MLCSQIDHLVVTAPNLDAGTAWVRQKLGVVPQAGGEHPRMGTHNRLLRLGKSVYIEIIAVNPDAPAPMRPRWFGLDRLRNDAEPALSAWVAAISDIDAGVSASSETLGMIEPMTRGALNWLITIPADGRIPLDGVAPALIEWSTSTHPVEMLEDRGLSLIKFEIFHPNPERVNRLLASIMFDGEYSVSPLAADKTPYLRAHIDTPKGLCLL